MPPPDRHRGTPSPAAEWFADLQRKARTRRWLVAVAVGAATGMFANLVLDWPITLLVAFLTAVALLSWDSRYGTLAGWWPTEQSPHRLAATAARLERHGWHILALTGATPGSIYLVIGPGGAFVVQHESWRLTTSPGSGLLLIDGHPAIRRIKPLLAAATTVEMALSGSAVQAVRCVLAVEALDEPHVIADVAIVPAAGLARLLRRGDIVLTEPEVAATVSAARRLCTDPSGAE